MADIPILYSFNETRQKLGVSGKMISRNLLNKLIAEQAISFTIVGHKKYTFSETAINEYLASRTVHAKTFTPEPTIAPEIESRTVKAQPYTPEPTPPPSAETITKE